MNQQLQQLLLWHLTLCPRSENEGYTPAISRISRVARLIGRGLQTLGRRLQRAGQRLADEGTPAPVCTPQPAER